VTAMDDERRILCVLPNLPERKTGGGILLFEVLAHLATRARVAAVVPVAAHLAREMEEVRRQPLLRGVEWVVLEPRRVAGVRGYVSRLLAATPAETTKFATEDNRARLEELRRGFRPTVELVVSSWAIAAYRGLRLPPETRLYMMDVDPAIVRYEGPSLKRAIAAAVDRPKVDRLCRRALVQAARVGSISPDDVPVLGRMGGRGDVTHVPPLMRPQPLDRSHAEPNTVLVTTNFTYAQNVTSLEWFFRECWPHVDPAARLTVTGKDENGRLEALCRGQPRTVYAGCLPSDALDREFARAAVAVNPTRSGSGFQIKLLDAIARGVPIVSTAFSNKLGPAIASSDDPRGLAALVNARLLPGRTAPFDYAAFHAAAVAAWERFLFGPPRPSSPGASA